ncbi:hypothetical protein DLAC_03138 [Tieghemostelium lacteum]|uniref:Uncharacterized protein n=1 Tax=Tieghemostelium lacteum TaxID=361077 RepID=A0A152A2F1_TIELA|nr:hypothetical protein DLAC_03138 [Tieghemostelium lacteum]|eukprot:KYR00390.1 hypothetical protein DLAC_03138 [Tieghemostelium lacteum]
MIIRNIFKFNNIFSINSKNVLHKCLNNTMIQPYDKRYQSIMKNRYGIDISPSQHQLNILNENEQKIKEERKQPVKYKRVVKSFDITPPDYDSMLFTLNDPEKVENSKKLNVAVIGAPNAGKSTLINSIVGEKICAVSPVEHTTRDTVLGVYTKDNVQLVFHDTPGIIKNFNRLSNIKEFVNMAWSVVKEADIVMLVVDSTNHNRPDTGYIIDRLSSEMMELLQEFRDQSKDMGKEFILVLNKVDLVQKKEDLIQLISSLNEDNIFSDTFVVSAVNNIKVDGLVDYLVTKSVPGEWQFESTLKTDQTDIFRASEIIKEKLFSTLRMEIPYSVTQNTVGWTEFRNGDLRIDHEFIVKKDIHKAFILGKRGKNISSIYLTAKKVLEQVFNRRVHLFLSVKVKKSINLYNDV